MHNLAVIGRDSADFRKKQFFIKGLTVYNRDRATEATRVSATIKKKLKNRWDKNNETVNFIGAGFVLLGVSICRGVHALR